MTMFMVTAHEKPYLCVTITLQCSIDIVRFNFSLNIFVVLIVLHRSVFNSIRFTALLFYIKLLTVL